MTDIFYRVEEVVGAKYYIVLDQLFTTPEAAFAAIAKMPSNRNMRVAEYNSGDYRGPERMRTMVEGEP